MNPASREERIFKQTIVIFSRVIFCIFLAVFLNDRYGRIGVASWYGGYFDKRPTASGRIYDQEAFTAAHRTLPFGTRLKVINLTNGKKVVVTITDRGPFVLGRIIDLSKAAARELDLLQRGTGLVLFIRRKL